MITANNPYEIDDTGVKYEDVIGGYNSEIRTAARIGPDTEEKIYVTIGVYNHDNQSLGSTNRELAAVDVDAYTPTGGNSTEDLYNQIEQAVVDYLEAFGANSGVTFTIN